MHGAVWNLETFGDAETVVERPLADPPGTLALLDGPFDVAAYDATDDRFVAATDTVGNRSLYHAADGILRDRG